jgi:hypothetical protein
MLAARHPQPRVLWRAWRIRKVTSRPPGTTVSGAMTRCLATLLGVVLPMGWACGGDPASAPRCPADTDATGREAASPCAPGYPTGSGAAPAPPPPSTEEAAGLGESGDSNAEARAAEPFYVLTPAFDANGASATAPSEGPGRELTVVVRGAGLGRVVSDPPGIDCGRTCGFRFAADAALSLRARPGNGSDARIARWSLAGCGVQSHCAVPDTGGDASVEVTFEPLTHNLVFISSEEVPTTLGSARGYDDVCNAAATRAGINDAEGDRFVAVVSSSDSPFRDRLGEASRGWTLLDGRPFADTVGQLFDEDRVQNPIVLDENGTPLASVVLTGTDSAGRASGSNCKDWSDPNEFTRYGMSSAGPGSWIDHDQRQCIYVGNVYCMGRGFVAPLEVVSAPGLRIWVSEERLVAGSRTPDEHCLRELPPGVTRARALVPYDGVPAAAALSPGRNYVRPDGVLVGTSWELLAQALESGVWQTSTGRYLRPSPDPTGLVEQRVWSGERFLDAPGLTGSTCNNWAGWPVGYSSTARAGRYTHSGRDYWDWAWIGCADTDGARVYCVEY